MVWYVLVSISVEKGLLDLMLSLVVHNILESLSIVLD